MHISSISPSFTTNSDNNNNNHNLADIAARVIEEFRNESRHDDDDDDDIYNFINDNNNNNNDNNNSYPDRNCTEKLKEIEEEQNEQEEEEEEKEFEFDVVCRNPNSSSPVSADEIFSNGEILPRYPLFDQSLLRNDVVSHQPDPNYSYYRYNYPPNDVVTYKTDSNYYPKFDRSLLLNDGVSHKPDRNFDLDTISESVPVRQPLAKLFREERETTSYSSSEVDNLAGVAPETYCIWKPKVEETTEKCKKSNSTGDSSKRWKLRNLLRRSNSDGRIAVRKEAPVADSRQFPATKKKGEKVKKVDKTSKVAGADDDGDVEMTPVTDEINNRFRSYLRRK